MEDISPECTSSFCGGIHHHHSHTTIRSRDGVASSLSKPSMTQLQVHFSPATRPCSSSTTHVNRIPPRAISKEEPTSFSVQTSTNPDTCIPGRLQTAPMEPASLFTFDSWLGPHRAPTSLKKRRPHTADGTSPSTRHPFSATKVSRIAEVRPRTSHNNLEMKGTWKPPESWTGPPVTRDNNAGMKRKSWVYRIACTLSSWTSSFVSPVQGIRSTKQYSLKEGRVVVVVEGCGDRKGGLADFMRQLPNSGRQRG